MSRNPVHLLPRDRDVQRIQHLMLATLWPEAVRETPKVLFINLVEDCNHSLLDNLVLRGSDPESKIPRVLAGHQAVVEGTFPLVADGR